MRVDTNTSPCPVCGLKPRRTLDQNAKFHAICRSIAASGKEFAGMTLSEDQWKVLLVSGHSAAQGRTPRVIPGLEGEFVNIRERTSKMSKERLGSLIEYSLAWCAMNEVEINEKS